MSTGDAPDFRIEPGAVLAGKYRIERILGQGGMGVVVAAHHIQLDETVALKFLLPETMGSPEAVARFVREARAAVKIKSEHVARVSDVGQLDSGLPYMVMEYLEGSDLSAWLAKRGALPVEQAVDFVLQACEAMAEAHALGIVHRDLKPANLFCVRRADDHLSIKVLDFGTSKITTPGAPGHGMTRTTALVGSPLYMSPEQMMSSKNVDVRTDIWSLGTILFELVAGHPPFTAESITELAVRVTTEPAPPLHSVVPGAPAALAQAVARCLEKDLTRRFQTVADLAMALEDLGSPRARASVERVLDTLRAAGMGTSRDSLARTALPSVAAVSSAQGLLAPNTAAAWGQTGSGTSTRSRSAGRTGMLVSVAAVVAIAAVGAGVLVARTTKGPSPAAIPAEITAAPSATVPPTSEPSSSSPTTVASAIPSTVPSASSPSGRMAVPPATVVSSPRPPPTPPVLPSAKPDCDPPYTVNAKGSRIFKKECL